MTSKIYLATAVSVALCSTRLVLSAYAATVYDFNNAFSAALAPSSTTAFMTPPEPREKAPAQTVKAVYLTASSANNSAKLDEIIKLINETELNAVVIDIKDYTGYILYNSKVPLAAKLGTRRTVLKDPQTIIQKLHDNNIYVIARQTVFQDPILAEKKPEWSIQSKAGGVWRDQKGLSWVDATLPPVWKYNMDIAKEAIKLGFDEMNFDYIRFPSDGNMSLVKYSSSSAKYKIMGSFYKYVKAELKDEPAWVSYDMFGMVMDAKGTNDLGIGQRLADALGNADYIAPMMYPSHYPPGYAGLKNPAADPATVFATGLSKGAAQFASSTTKLRPWIQAFNMGAVYDGAKIRAQIDQIEKYSDAGFMMWNASNRYSKAGLKDE